MEMYQLHRAPDTDCQPVFNSRHSSEIPKNVALLEQKKLCFISHPNGIVLRVLKRQRSTIEMNRQHAGAKQRSTEQRLSSSSMVLRNKRRAQQQRLPSFISHPNGIVLRVFKRQRSMIQRDQDQRRVCAKQRSPSSSVPSFICHPNGIVLRVLNKKQS